MKNKTKMTSLSFYIACVNLAHMHSHKCIIMCEYLHFSNVFVCNNTTNRFYIDSLHIHYSHYELGIQYTFHP